MKPGKPVRLYVDDVRKFPTVDLPYGTIPIVHASAGMKRILSLSYLIAWSWSEHVQASRLIGWQPSDRIVVLMEEPETHLHPRWQRHIVSALLGVLGRESSAWRASHGRRPSLRARCGSRQRKQPPCRRRATMPRVPGKPNPQAHNGCCAVGPFPVPRGLPSCLPRTVSGSSGAPQLPPPHRFRFLGGSPAASPAPFPVPRGLPPASSGPFPARRGQGVLCCGGQPRLTWHHVSAGGGLRATGRGWARPAPTEVP
ncbi:AAA family ATPase [Sorangium sp. So ce1182]|uniref:AAA family ATPase n=1 Tax=Sorangium sp. So ce1182 TaxID=3133334 RepID=UPI003F5FD3C3